MARADVEGQGDASARVLWLGSERAPAEVTQLFEAWGFQLLHESDTDSAARPPFRVASLSLVGPPARGRRKPSIAGRRIAVAHSDPGVADGMAQTVRALGATAAVVSASELGLARVAALQPNVVLFDPADLRSEGAELLRAAWSDAQLRWTPVLLTPSACFDASGSVEFDRMVACIDALVAPYDELMESAATEECFEVPLSDLGPVQTLRALVETGGCFSAQFETPDLDINVDIAEGIIVGAQRQGDRERVLGPRALAILTRQVSGHVFVVQSERPAVTNIMAPIETALSAASTERSSWLPSHMPPPSDPKLEAPRFVVGNVPTTAQMTSKGVGPGKGMPTLAFPSPGFPPGAMPPKEDDEVTQVAPMPDMAGEAEVAAPTKAPNTATRPALRNKAGVAAGTLLGIPTTAKPENDAGLARQQGLAKGGPKGGMPAPSVGSLPRPAAYDPAQFEPDAPTLPPQKPQKPAVAEVTGANDAAARAASQPEAAAGAQPLAAELPGPQVEPPPAATELPGPQVEPPPAAEPPGPQVEPPPVAGSKAASSASTQPAGGQAADAEPPAPELPMHPSVGARLDALLESVQARLRDVDWDALRQQGHEAVFWIRHSRVAWGIGGALLVLLVLVFAFSGDSEPAEAEQTDVVAAAEAAAQAAPSPAAPAPAAPSPAPAAAEKAAPAPAPVEAQPEAVQPEEQAAAALAEEEAATADEEALDEEALDQEAALDAEVDEAAEAEAGEGSDPTPYERASYLVSHGNRAQRAKRYKQAEGFFERALKVLPNYPRAIEGLTEVFLAMRNRKAALQNARKLVSLRPGRARHHRLLGDAYAANMDFANAQHAWKKAAAKGDRAAKKRLGQ